MTTRTWTSRPAWAGLALALVIIAGLPAPAVLAQDCDRPDTQAQVDECAVLRLRAAERELTSVLDRLMKSADQDFKTALKQSQDAWLNWRDAEGALAAVAASDPVLAVSERLKVQSQLTEDRVKDLRSYAPGS